MSLRSRSGGQRPPCPTQPALPGRRVLEPLREQGWATLQDILTPPSALWDSVQGTLIKCTLWEWGRVLWDPRGPLLWLPVFGRSSHRQYKLPVTNRALAASGRRLGCLSGCLVSIALPATRHPGRRSQQLGLPRLGPNCTPTNWFISRQLPLF